MIGFVQIFNINLPRIDSLVQPLQLKILEARNRLAMIELRINDVERYMTVLEERQFRPPAKPPSSTL